MANFHTERRTEDLHRPQCDTSTPVRKMAEDKCTGELSSQAGGCKWSDAV